MGVLIKLAVCNLLILSLSGCSKRSIPTDYVGHRLRGKSSEVKFFKVNAIGIKTNSSDPIWDQPKSEVLHAPDKTQSITT